MMQADSSTSEDEALELDDSSEGDRDLDGCNNECWLWRKFLLYQAKG